MLKKHYSGGPAWVRTQDLPMMSRNDMIYENKNGLE